MIWAFLYLVVAVIFYEAHVRGAKLVPGDGTIFLKGKPKTEWLMCSIFWPITLVAFLAVLIFAAIMGVLTIIVREISEAIEEWK